MHPSGRWSGAELPGRLVALGFPPGGPAHRHEGETVVHVHDWHADIALIRRTAARLRADPECARRAGVARDEDVDALVALLDLLAAQVPHLNPAVRREVVEACRQALGEGARR